LITWIYHVKMHAVYKRDAARIRFSHLSLKKSDARKAKSWTRHWILLYTDPRDYFILRMIILFIFGILHHVIIFNNKPNESNKGQHSLIVAAGKCRHVLHYFVGIYFWSAGIIDCTLFTFENSIPLMRYGTSVVWHLSWSFITIDKHLNKTEGANFPKHLWFLGTFRFLRLMTRMSS